QQQKAAQLKPEEQNKVERGLNWFQSDAILERFSNGIHGVRPKLGGLAPGSGFAIGPEYRRTDLMNGQLTFRVSAQSSFRGYRKFDFDLGAPKLASGRFFTEFYAVHHDYPSLSYYGPGPDSNKTGRTDFRLEDTALDFTFGVRPARNFTAGSTAGYVF